MTNTAMSVRITSRIGRFLVFAAIAIGSVLLQVAMVRRATLADSLRIDEPGHLNNSWRAFWYRTFRLDGHKSIGGISGTICDGELILLVASNVSRSNHYFPAYWTERKH